MQGPLPPSFHELVKEFKLPAGIGTHIDSRGYSYHIDTGTHRVRVLMRDRLSCLAFDMTQSSLSSTSPKGHWATQSTPNSWETSIASLASPLLTTCCVTGPLLGWLVCTLKIVPSRTKLMKTHMDCRLNSNDTRRSNSSKARRANRPPSFLKGSTHE
jgi:hypothetical protein